MSLTVSFCEACLLLSAMIIYLNFIKGRPSGWCSGRQKHRKRLSNQFAPTPTFFIISGCCLQKFLIRRLVVCAAALCASFVFYVYMISVFLTDVLTCKKNTEMQYMCVKWTLATINSIRGQYGCKTNILQMLLSVVQRHVLR